MINRTLRTNNITSTVKPPILHPTTFVQRGEVGVHDEHGEVSWYQLSPVFLSFYYAFSELDMNIE